MSARLEARWPLVLVAIALVAAAARTVAAISLWSLPHAYVLNADSGEYHAQALTLAGLIDGTLPPVFRLSPGTVLWGALWHRLFGPSPWAVVVPQIVLGAGTALLCASCAKRLAGPIAGACAGLLVALCKPLVLYDVAVLPTGPATFLSAAFALVALSSFGSPSRRAAIMGLVLGAACAFRPNLALLVPAAFALAVFGREVLPLRRKALSGLALLAALALPLLPIAASNLLRGGELVPFTSGLGINLFIGNHQGSTGRLNPVFDTHSAADAFARFGAIANERAGRDLSDGEVSAFWTARAAEEIADDPARFAALLARKLIYGVNDFETPDNLNPAFLEEISAALAAPLPGFAVLLCLGLPGLVVLWRGRPRGTRALHGIAAAAIVTMLIFFVSGRYRAVALPALAIAAGVFLTWAAARVRAVVGPDRVEARRAASALAAAALFVALLATVAHLPILHPRYDAEIARLCAAWEAEGRVDRASTCAATLSPGDAR